MRPEGRNGASQGGAGGRELDALASVVRKARRLEADAADDSATLVDRACAEQRAAGYREALADVAHAIGDGRLAE